MNNSFDTSFIPQQPLLKVEGSPRRLASLNFALILAFVIFFVALMVWGGMYFYKTSIDRRILTSEKELESKELSLKPDEIDRYKAIDERLNIAKQLLENHISFSAILTLLEKVTAKNIGWTALSYITDSTNGSTSLHLTGQASDYSAVYAQAEAWRSMPTLLTKVEVSIPQLNIATGIVTFEAILAVDPNYSKYARIIKEGETVPGLSSAGATSTSLGTP